VQRLKSHREFIEVLRHRQRVTSADIVAHYAWRSSDFAADPDEKRLGLAVSNTVGHAVVRNHIKRQFRVLGRQYEQLLPAGCDVILRAKRSAAHADFASLEQQVDQLFQRIKKRLSRSRSPQQSHTSDSTLDDALGNTSMSSDGAGISTSSTM
jgi:ribonuclease P protein component